MNITKANGNSSVLMKCLYLKIHFKDKVLLFIFSPTFIEKDKIP